MGGNGIMSRGHDGRGCPPGAVFWGRSMQLTRERGTRGRNILIPVTPLHSLPCLPPNCPTPAEGQWSRSVARIMGCRQPDNSQTAYRQVISQDASCA